MTELSEPSVAVEPNPYPPARGVRLVARVIVSIVLLAIGLVAMKTLVANKPAAPRAETGAVATPVEVIAVRAGRQRLVVSATGVVGPARQVVIGAEVPGRVVSMASDLAPGGRFRQGQPLLRVDARDYQLAVEQQTAQVTLARTELEVEKGRKRIAEKEWQLLGEQPPTSGSLALRDPQLHAAEGMVRSAESGLRRTRLAVSKTGINAPFNSLVLTRNVDLGQIVSPGQPLATLVGTDAFWIQVTVPMSRVPAISVPGLSGATAGSPVRIRQRVGTQVLERRGQVVRMAGDLDPIGRMARVIVELLDPLALGSPGQPPLLLNSFVEVEFEGDEVDQVFELPRVALRDDDRVWVMKNQRLAIRAVDVVWRRRDTVVVSGLTDGDQVIVSPLATPAEGLALRDVSAAPPAAAPPAAIGSGS